MDGTLLESEAADLRWLRKAVETVLSDRGIDRREKDVLALSGIRSSEDYFRAKRGIEPEENFFMDICTARAALKLRQLKKGRKDLIDGSEKVISTLRKNNYEIGVVSNSPEKSLEEVLRFFDLERYVDYYRGVQDETDLRLKKPDDFLVEIAEAELTGRGFYVGDSEADGEAAEKADLEPVIIGEDVSSIRQVPDFIQRSEDQV